MLWLFKVQIDEKNTLLNIDQNYIINFRKDRNLFTMQNTVHMNP